MKIKDKTVTNFLFQATLNTITIGNTLPIENEIDVIQEQDGDIPSIYEYIIENICFEINCLNNIVIGIRLSFDYDPENKYTIIHDNNIIVLSFYTEYETFLNFIEKSGINYKIEQDESDMVIELQNKIKLLFHSGNLYKIYIFDIALYESIRFQ